MRRTTDELIIFYFTKPIRISKQTQRIFARQLLSPLRARFFYRFPRRCYSDAQFGFENILRLPRTDPRHFGFSARWRIPGRVVFTRTVST